MDFDVLFIGSGQAAWNGAIPMSQAGLKVGVIEQDRFGGVCSNYGCNAKIILDRPVELQRQVQQLVGRGFNEVPALNWADMMAHKHEIIDSQSYNNENKLVKNNVTTIHGTATIVDQRTVTVGADTYTTDKLVIATGQHSHRLDIPGSEFLHDSSDFLDLATMPKHISFLGGGFVALEFATIANALGAQVDIIVRGTQVLKGFYQPYVKQLVADLSARGVRFFYNQTIAGVTQDADGLVIMSEKDLNMRTDYVVDATGRVATVAGFGLETIGVTTNQHGIVVDEYMQTNVPGVYATGDVVGKRQPKITPVAAYESQYLAKLLTGQTSAPIDYPVIPTTVFTSPRLAQVGVSPAEMTPENGYYQQKFTHVTDWYHQVGNQTSGELTLVFNAEHRLIGVVDLSDDAPDTINALAPYIELGLTAEQVERLIYIFPSVAHRAVTRL
ncbi:NAD(P)/FAD-dependent oxidoreductase [Periweissella cryptocerci]|uniref:NAD(P)/FAD-dependent oxidoreductase n=2 Tax=Periweissella cryptocerci TaxID=2506420 RepID=A0A4P6YX83_9LACO|nr:NAD(P)/FAD-dependent oxidoreductase [Periweissella cryptocerci]QBO37470.1 NAD(P)/FAD-dependent oxidoreductase [Periweissella cryptocerci]